MCLSSDWNVWQNHNNDYRLLSYRNSIGKCKQRGIPSVIIWIWWATVTDTEALHCTEGISDATTTTSFTYVNRLIWKWNSDVICPLPTVFVFNHEEKNTRNKFNTKMINLWLLAIAVTLSCILKSQLIETSKSCPLECICLSQTQVSQLLLWWLKESMPNRIKVVVLNCQRTLTVWFLTSGPQ